jgi:crotonobetainyl-CoA:carnitine CoA-transferase CaiB-like acyl-CoA transferase
MANVTRKKETGPLEGLKVVDLSHIMAGPACSMLLADMGADVIKVEKYRAAMTRGEWCRQPLLMNPRRF